MRMQKKSLAQSMVRKFKVQHPAHDSEPKCRTVFNTCHLLELTNLPYTTYICENRKTVTKIQSLKLKQPNAKRRITYKSQEIVDNCC